MSSINYNGKNYPTRELTILVDGQPQDVVIAPQSLSDAFGDNIEKHGSIANTLDEGIYFYADDNDMELSDEILALNLDEEFNLAPEAGLKVILEFYMEIWYCYEDGKSMAYPLFTDTSYQGISDTCEACELDVIQTIDLSYLDEGEGAE